jgi:hypothetical protein
VNQNSERNTCTENQLAIEPLILNLDVRKKEVKKDGVENGLCEKAGRKEMLLDIVGIGYHQTPEKILGRDRDWREVVESHRHESCGGESLELNRPRELKRLSTDCTALSVLSRIHLNPSADTEPVDVLNRASAGAGTQKRIAPRAACFKAEPTLRWFHERREWHLL